MYLLIESIKHSLIKLYLKEYNYKIIFMILIFIFKLKYNTNYTLLI